jgi:hypothetical protein
MKYTVLPLALRFAALAGKKAPAADTVWFHNALVVELAPDCASPLAHQEPREATGE